MSALEKKTAEAAAKKNYLKLKMVVSDDRRREMEETER